MSTIMASVGENGKNLHPDVILVQTLLKLRGFDPGRMDGICDSTTINAIRQFQTTFLGRSDGLIEPGKKTWSRLSGAGPSPQGEEEEWGGDSSTWPQEKKL